MTETFTCPECGLAHSIYQRQCEITGKPISSPEPTTRVEPPDTYPARPDVAPSLASEPLPDAVVAKEGPQPGQQGGGDPFGGPNVSVSILGTEIDLRTGRPLMIGRESPGLANGAPLPDNVSATHVSVRLDRSGAVYLSDRGSTGRGSTNGTFVNRRQLQPNVEVPVGPDDEIHLGQDPATTIKILFR